MPPKRKAPVVRTGAKQPTPTPKGNTALTHALRAAGRGCLVVPCGLDKKPLIKSWNNGAASSDPKQIRAWDKRHDCYGFSSVCGGESGEVVVDVDTHRNGSVATLGITLPPTLSVRTPHGGTQYRFSVNDKVPTNPKLAEGVELLGEGHLAMLPGSKYALENGQVVEYKLRGNTRRIAPLPAALIRGSERPQEARSGDAIAQGTRNTTLASLAGTMRYAGATVDEILLALQTFRDTRCEIPETLLDSELEAMARDIGGRDGAVEREVVKLRTRDAARVIVARESAPEVVLPLKMTLDEYYEAQSDTVPYTIADLHPTGFVTIINGRGKMGKTTIVTNLIKSLADGVSFLGKYEITFDEGTAALWDYEMDQRMYSSWLRAMNIENRDRVVPPAHLRGLPNPLLRPEICVEWLRERKVKYWILDSAIRASAGYVANENDNSQVNEFFSVLETIKVEAGVEDVLIVHHLGSAFVAEGDEKSRGATRWDDAADVTWTVTKDGSNRRLMHAKGRGVNIEPEDAVALQWNPQTYELRVIGTKAVIRADEGALTATASLSELDEPPTSSHFRDKVLTKTEERAGYKEALWRGWIEQYSDKELSSRATYLRVTEAGNEALRRRVRMSGS